MLFSLFLSEPSLFCLCGVQQTLKFSLCNVTLEVTSKIKVPELIRATQLVRVQCTATGHQTQTHTLKMRRQQQIRKSDKTCEAQVKQQAALIIKERDTSKNDTYGWKQGFRFLNRQVSLKNQTAQSSVEL